MLHSTRSRCALMAVAAAVLAACGAPNASTAPTHPAGDKPRIVTLDAAHLSHGRLPKLAWMNGMTLHQGTRTTTLPGSRAAEVAVTEARIVTSGINDDTDNVVRVRNLDGTVTAEYPNPTSKLVTNDEHNLVAWTTDDGVPMVLQDGRPDPIALPKADRGDAASASAVLGHDCVNSAETVQGAGCSVYFTISRDRMIVALVSSNHGFVDKATSKITQLNDVSSSHEMIGWTLDSGARVCSRFESQDKSYRTCDYMPMKFSPDEKRYLAFPSEVGEGPAMDEISVRDKLSGKPVIIARSPKRSWTLWDAAWEDSSHVLLVIDQDEKFSIVRVGLDGHVERAVGPVKSPTANFSFAVQP